MIVASQKPIQELADAIAGFKQVVCIACDSCVTVCLSGGKRETEMVALELTHEQYYEQNPPNLTSCTIQRQCEQDLVKQFTDFPPNMDAILSFGCGAGTQTLASLFPDIPVIPALNTTFLGAIDEPGVWREKCHGCGDCILLYTGGICPVARCSKSLLNGPCGGSSEGKCEVSEDIECAWQLILDRLTALDRLDYYEKSFPLKNWSSDRFGGPRTLRRDLPLE